VKHESKPRAGSGPDEWFAFFIIGVGVLVVGVWSGAQVATLLNTGHFLDASISDAIRAMGGLMSNSREPAMAWPKPVQPDLPGRVLYWVSTGVVVTIELGLWVWLCIRVFTWRIGTAKRERLGVSTNAKLATARDLKTIAVAGPSKGRLILGVAEGQLVATETIAAPTTRPGTSINVKRQGDRSAVAIIGPTRSGKTANVIAGILEWDGPAILSSVRDDLFDRTFTRRNQVGTVFVFDPLEELGNRLPEGAVRVGWSPLQIAGTVSGAMEASSVLLAAAPLDGTTNANYFSKKGEALLWPILFAAAVGGKSMADVVRWLAVQDGTELETPVGGGEEILGGEVRRILRDKITDHTQPAMAKQAVHALTQFDGFWKLDHRTRSDIYSTTQTLVQPWEDPMVSFASSPGVGPAIDLNALLVGRNTLYVVQPLKSVERFAVVFGGVLGALLKDQAYEISHRIRGPIPDLLVVIDEAGNTPMQWLPDVASTCSGIGVLLVTIWQSKAQVDAIYQKQADPLLTNHGSKLFFAGASDEATLRYATFLCGEEEVHQRSANSDIHLASARRSIGDSTTHRRLLPADVLRQAIPGEGLLIHGTLPPAHIRSRRYWQDAALSEIAAGNGPDFDEWVVDDELAAAFRLDATPRLEILDHLPSYVPPVSATPAGSPQAESARSFTPQPLGWVSERDPGATR